ncbi:MAG: acetyl-CoA carboxylase biotin carboxyl carrier protein [Clostridiaceae bacterium]
MDIKEIRALAQLMERANLSVLELNEADKKIRMERTVSAPILPFTAQEISAPAPRDDRAQPEGAVDFNRITEVISPMVGVFYAAPSPDASPYVQIGSKVKKGDVLCIIEAMKLMNEIVAETDGEIVDVCAANGQIVEYAQILFKVF